MGKKTDKLGNELERIAPEEIGRFLDENWGDMLDGEREFTVFMRKVVRSKELKWKDVYVAAGGSEDYGHEIIAMRKHTRSRDLIIRLCLAAQLDLEDTQHALKLYGMQPLYPRIPRDTVFIVAINRRIYDLGEIDEMLAGQGFEIISGEVG